MDNSQVLAGKVVVISGASSGIGRAVALEVARQGGIPCLIGRRIDALNSVLSEVREYVVGAQCYEADLTDDDAQSNLLVLLKQDFDGLDALVHCAGVFAMGAVETESVARLDWQYKINVRAPYLLTQHLLPSLKQQQGQIVFVNSTVGLAAKSGVAQYAASKAALKAIADALREEVNPDGVRVLSIYPGRTASPMQEAIHKMEKRNYDSARLMQSSDVADAIVYALSAPRTAEVTDITVRPMARL
ncbi:MAG: SDR family NAD(P)-dependent oxidoreductase [Gammaproteobacteria bacterium]|nr:SDR family NAD(P)-dependent oxidoreductase [Gammaproteobacteria bacterium]